MIKLEKPQFDMEEIVNACISNMNQGEVKTRILSSKNEIVEESNEYDEKAKRGNLSSFKIHEKLGGGATKEDMKKCADLLNGRVENIFMCTTKNRGVE